VVRETARGHRWLAPLQEDAMTRRRGILYVAGALLIIGPPALWIVSSLPVASPRPLEVPVGRLAAALSPGVADLAALAERDPLALVRIGRARYEKTVREYRCVLVKQERLGNKLSDVQKVELRFREEPRAVYMLWQANADGARRALYLPGQRDYTNDKGEPLARVEPNGAIARLFVKDTYVPIHGPEAHKASRRAIDEAGFHASFDLLEAFNAIAAEHGVLNVRYAGTGTVDGRPTYVLVRDLPYTGPKGPYPDARLVLHLDQEWLLPTAVYSYADHQQKKLLGSYEFTQVELNPGFGPDTFQF
jgi:hypothetical protein